MKNSFYLTIKISRKMQLGKANYGVAYIQMIISRNSDRKIITQKQIGAEISNNEKGFCPGVIASF